MRLKLKTCTVRSFEWRDREAIVRHGNNRKVSINLRDHFPYPYTDRDARNWLELAIGAEPETNFAIDVAGEAVGSVGFTLLSDVDRRSAEIGYWLGEGFWGRGIATEALITVTSLAFTNHDLCRVFAHVFDWNPASARVLEKAGFTFEGRLRKSVTKEGRTIDQLMYAVIRE